jgi:hypothetical protein
MNAVTPTPIPRLYCEDCCYVQVPDTGKNYARCGHPEAVATGGDRFVARELDKPPHAATMRERGDKCGHDGEWFVHAPAPAVSA